MSPGASRLADDVQGGLAARGFPLFKIPLALSHLVRHVGKTDDLVLPGLCQRVEGGGLHFHRQDTLGATPRDHRFRLPKRRIGRPTGAHVQGKPPLVPMCADHLAQGGMQVAVRRGRRIMVACPLVAQGFLNEDYVRRLAQWEDLARRGDADQQLAARSEQFLGHQHRKRSAHHPPDNAVGHILMHERIQARMVTGPGVMRRETVGGPQVIDEIAVRIKHADRRDAAFGKSFLPPCLAEQVLRRKDRRGLRVFVSHNNEILPRSSP